MSFNESNTVEQMILDAVENLDRTTAAEICGLADSLSSGLMPTLPMWGTVNSTAWPL